MSAIVGMTIAKEATRSYIDWSLKRPKEDTKS